MQTPPYGKRRHRLFAAKGRAKFLLPLQYKQADSSHGARIFEIRNPKDQNPKQFASDLGDSTRRRRDSRDVAEFLRQLSRDGAKLGRRRAAQLGEPLVGLQQMLAKFSSLDVRNLQRHGIANPCWAIIGES